LGFVEKGSKIRTLTTLQKVKEEVFVIKVQQQTDSVVEISRKVAKKMIHKYLPRFQGFI